MPDEATRQANVVLTADTSGYDQSVQQSASTTETLIGAVDTLTKKLSDISRSAGKKLLIFSAADVAGITAATAAYGAYENQLSNLDAQAAVLSKTMAGSRDTFKQYESSVASLRKQFPTTTAEAAQLVEVLAKMGTVAPNQIKQMSTIFMNAAGATGESATGLASSILNLQQVMGADNKNVEKYTDSIVTLAAKSNTSAEGLANFASSIAPIGRIAGMTQTQILGVSAAFTKSGQDGYYAANAFNKMLSDITYATQSGSPDLAKYANLIGLTAEQFKTMDKSQAVVQIFDSLNRMGPQAITVLNRMGLDGMRTMKAITAVTQTSGGLGASIQTAERAYGSGATQAGGRAAYGDLADQMARWRESVKETGETIGKTFAPAMEAFARAMTSATQTMNAFLSGPAGKLLQWAGAALAPLAAVTGALLGLAGPLAAFAGIRAITRGAPRLGLQAGFASGRGGGPIMAPSGGQPGYNFIQNWMYGAGHLLGGGVGSVGTAAFGAPTRGGPSLASRMMALPLWAGSVGANFLAEGVYGPGTIAGRDPGQRTTLFNRARLRDYFGAADILREQGDTEATRRRGFMAYGASVLGGLGLPKYQPGGENDPEKVLRGLNRESGLVEKTFKGLNRESMNAGTQMRAFGGGLKNLLFSMGSTALMAGGATAAVGAKGFAGVAGALGINPYVAGGLAAAGIGYYAYNRWGKREPFKLDTSAQTPYQEYYQALGIPGMETTTTPAGAAGGYQLPQNTTMADALKITTDERIDAARADYEYQSKAVEKYSEDQWDQFLADQRAIFSYTPPSKIDPRAMQMQIQDVMHKWSATRAQQFIDMIDDANTYSADEFVTRLVAASGTKEREAVGTSMLETYKGRYSAAAGVDAATATAVKFGDLTKQLDEGVKLTGEDLTAFSDTLKEEGIFPGGLSFEEYVQSTQQGVTQAGQAGGVQTTGGGFMTAGQQATTAGTGKVTPTTEGYYQAQIEFLAKNAPDKLADIRDELKDQGITQSSTNKEVVDALLSEKTPRDLQLDILKKSANTNDKLLRATTLVETFTTRQQHEAEIHPESPLAQFRAQRQLFRAARAQPSFAAGMAALQQGIGQGLDPTSQIYQNIMGAQQMMLQRTMERAPMLGRAETFARVQTGLGAQMAIIRQGGISDTEVDQYKALRDQMVQNRNEQFDYYKQIAYQVREFNVSRRRAEDDFHTQQMYMLEDYNISRERAERDYQIQRRQQEFDFNLTRKREEADYQRTVSRATFDYDLSRSRSIQDYNIQRRQAEQDFNIQRERTEEDFNHQKVLMFRQAAQQMYDIYQRITVQPTVSADTLATNAQDQLQAMRTQSRDLEQLRQMGVSNAVIQQLGLNDPKRAQQTERFLQDMLANPQQIKQFNRMIQQRIRAARGLLTDEANQDWAEFNRQHRVALRRNEEDFERSMDRSQRQFRRGLARQADDFQRMLNLQRIDHNRMMNQQLADYDRMRDRQDEQFATSMDDMADDFGRATNRMTTQYNLMMRRASQDLHRSATEITGNFNEIMKKAMPALRGTARDQADLVMGVLDDLRVRGGNRADQIISMFERKFGVKFAPSATGNTSGGEPGQMGRNDRGTDPQNPPHGGGFAPSSPTSAAPREPMVMGPTSHRDPGGRRGQQPNVRDDPFRVYNPMGAGYVDKDSNYGQRGSHWASFHTGEDMPAATGHPIYAAMDGRVIYVGWGGAYGNLTKIAHPNGVQTWYAHQSQQNVARGDHVEGGQKIGAVGATGNTTGPHLHFEYRINGVVHNPAELLQGMAARGYTGATSGAGVDFDVQDFLNRQYRGVENAATNLMTGMPRGAMSRRINSMALRMLRRYARSKGKRLMDLIDGNTRIPGGVPEAPANISGDIRTGRMMAAADPYNWTGNQWDALYQLWLHESNWNKYAENQSSGAYGIPQSLPASKMASAGRDWATNAATQIEWGLKYIKGAYGSPANAWAKWQSRDPHWYEQGAIFKEPRKIGIAERGPEAVLPLTDRGLDFLAALMRRVTPGMEARSIGVAGHGVPMITHTTNMYRIDKSNKFSGPITVVASSPTDFIASLREQQRTGALAQPLLNGMAA